MLSLLTLFKEISSWKKLTTYCQKTSNAEKNLNNDFFVQPPLKILMLTPYPPYPPNTGAAIRRFEQIKYLGKSHHLVVVSFIAHHKDYAFEKIMLNNYCELAIMVKMRISLLPILSKQPKLIKKFDSLKMWKVLKKLKEVNFDIVLFDSIFMTQYHKLFNQSYQVLCEHNIESKLVKQLTITNLNKSKFKLLNRNNEQVKLIEKYENNTWSIFPLRTVVSECDKQELDCRCPVGETLVVKNGIDTRKTPLFDNKDAKKILFMGLMSYQPNIDAVCYFSEHIMPRVWQQDPEIKFCIAGRNPVKQVRKLVNDPRIEVIANPEDMNKIAQQCSMTVVPLRIGSGTRIKILHSMAMGLPVVSTSIGCEGLEVVDGFHLLIKDQPAEFAEAILQTSRDSELRSKLQKNGRHLVEAKYDWNKIFRQFEAEILLRYYSFL
jgi:glycosyltransferase involved in cell wall biosynthesis